MHVNENVSLVKVVLSTALITEAGLLFLEELPGALVGTQAHRL